MENKPSFIYFFIILSWNICSCNNATTDNNKANNKYFDENGIILMEHLNNNHTKAFQYYKDTSLYKVEFLTKVAADTDRPELIRIDSTYLYSFKTKKRILKTKRINTDLNDYRKIITYYSELEFPIKLDTLEHYLAYKKIEKNLLGLDTLQLQYIPVTK